jgi:hypothetical protein
VNGLAARVTDAGGQFRYTDAGNYFIGTVLGEAGITTNGGDIHLRTVSGTITFNADVTSNNGDIYLENATPGQLIFVGWDPLVPGSMVILPTGGDFSHLFPGTGIIYLGGATSGNAYIGTSDFGVKNIGVISGQNILSSQDWNPAIICLITANRLGLQAPNGVIGTAALPINTSVAQLDSASNGATWINEVNDILLNTMTTADGRITVVAGGKITVNTITAGGAGRDVWLTTTGVGQDIDIPGNITALDDVVYLNASGNITDTTDQTSRIRAGTLQIDAAQTVGSPALNGWLDTEVDWYLNHRVTAGDAYFYEINDVILRDLEYRAGRLNLFSGGSIYGSHRFPADAVEGFYGITLTALGTIGTADQPLWVDAPYGSVNVSAYGERDRLSANLYTETPFSYNHEPYDLFHVANYSPGLVLYNYRIMGGNPTSDVKNRGYYFLDAIFNQEMAYLYYDRWEYDWSNYILKQNILKATELISDQRAFGEHAFLNTEDLGLSLRLDKAGRLIMLKKGLEQMDLGTVYPPMRSPFVYPPFWVNELR